MIVRCHYLAIGVVEYLRVRCLATLRCCRMLRIPGQGVWSGLFSLILLAGCYTKSPLPGASEEVETPYKVRVVGEELTDGILAVQVGVTAIVPWDPDSVIVEISTIKNAEREASAFYKIGDLIIRPLGVRLVPANLEVAVPLQIDAKEASDYQISLKWGADAVSYLDTTQEQLKAKARFVLTESILQSRPCAGIGDALEQGSVQGTNASRCPLRYVVKGQIVNDGPGVLKEVTLGVSLVARGGGNLEGEERQVTLPRLQLAPQRSSRISINVDRDLSPEAASVLIPSVRIIE